MFLKNSEQWGPTKQRNLFFLLFKNILTLILVTFLLIHFSVSVFFKKLQIYNKQRIFSATLMYVVWSTILSDALHQRVQKTLRMQTQIVSRKSLKYCITLKFHHLSRNQRFVFHSTSIYISFLFFFLESIRNFYNLETPQSYFFISYFFISLNKK